MLMARVVRRQTINLRQAIFVLRLNYFLVILWLMEDC